MVIFYYVVKMKFLFEVQTISNTQFIYYNKYSKLDLILLKVHNS